MKKLSFLMIILALAGAIALANSFSEAREGGQERAQCMREFKHLDTENNGYLSYEEFRKGFDDVNFSARSPHTDDYWRTILGGRTAPNAQSAFATANTNRDGRLTVEQYCAWKAH